MNARRPHNFYVGFLGGSESKMKTLVTCRSVASSGGRESRLSIYFHASTESVTVAARSAQRNYQPMQLATAIHEHLRMATQIGHHDILPAIVVQVAKRGATRGYRIRAPGVNAFEAAIMVHRQKRQFKVVKRGIDLFHIVQHMALGYEQVFPTVVVKVFQAHTPTRAST